MTAPPTAAVSVVSTGVAELTAVLVGLSSALSLFGVSVAFDTGVVVLSSKGRELVGLGASLIGAIGVELTGAMGSDPGACPVRTSAGGNTLTVGLLVGNGVVSVVLVAGIVAVVGGADVFG